MDKNGGLRVVFKRLTRRDLDFFKTTIETPKQKNTFAEVFFYAESGGVVWGKIV